MGKVVAKGNVNPNMRIPMSQVVGLEICDVYINLLCERYKNRGVTSRVKQDAQRQSERHNIDVRNAPAAYGIEYMKVSPYDAKFRTGEYKGQAYMSADDFANYYRALRDYKTPRQASRSEDEYAIIEEKAIQKRKEIEAGTRSKKAKWLAILHILKAKLSQVRSHLNRQEYKKFSAEWFPADCEENRRESKGRKIPKGIIPSLVIVSLSLLMIVTSTVMVSRAEIEVADLEYQIDSREKIRDELLVDTELKNNMLIVKEWAMQNGMVSGEYVNSKHIDVEKPESIQSFEKTEQKGVFQKLLEAIGIIKD